MINQNREQLSQMMGWNDAKEHGFDSKHSHIFLHVNSDPFLLVFAHFYRNYKMESQNPRSSLSQKLQLLKALRSGKLQESQAILANLSSTSRTNPDLYNKFHSFLSTHRQEIEHMQRQERVQEQRVILVEGSDDDEWKTDDSVSLSSEEEEKQEPLREKEEERVEKRLMRNVSNTKSTTLLQNIKEVKRPFLVQTKAKETNGLINHSLKVRNSSTSKLQLQNKSLMTTLSKSNLLLKTLPKHASKPYFPPINVTKSTLKLVHK